jgi:hypothetical protein
LSVLDLADIAVALFCTKYCARFLLEQLGILADVDASQVFIEFVGEKSKH